jgi:uncharacterized protein YwqG
MLSSFLTNKVRGIPTTHKAKDVMFFKRKQPEPNNISEEIKRLQDTLAKHKRTAWKPVTKEGDGGIFSSKFSGLPYLAKNEDWPCCQRCGKEMTFFLQLNLETLPHRNGEGLLQLFYCVHCSDWQPFSLAHLVRLVQPQSVGNTPVTLPVKMLPNKRIITWEAFEEYPTYVEWDELSIPVQAPDMVAEAVENMLAKEGDKLAGWPYWVQWVEYPSCPKCSKRMELVFQLDSNDNLDFMFGDAGCGHITQCPEHQDVLAFGWACH